MKKFLLILFGLFAANMVLVLPDISYAQGTPGISTGYECLMGMGKDCFRYEDLVDKVDKSKRSAKDVAQDVVMAATYIVGTVLTIVILYCGLMYILAARSGKDPKEYKKGLINAGIGAVLVRGAYAIVRLIQYIAKG